MLSETRRVIKPNGVLYLATRSADKEKVIVEDAPEGGRMSVNYHTLKIVTDALIGCKFKVIDAYETIDDIGRPLQLYARVCERNKIGFQDCESSISTTSTMQRHKYF